MRRGASGKAAHLLALPPERNAYSAGMRTLESCELFSGLNEKALAAVRAAVTEKAFVKGTLIIAEGTDADALYVVDQGEVEIAAAPDGATHRVVSRLGPGESFGEMAVVEDKPRSANVVAAVDCVVLKIPRPAQHHRHFRPTVGRGGYPCPDAGGLCQPHPAPGGSRHRDGQRDS